MNKIGTVLTKYGGIKFISDVRENLLVVLSHYGLDDSAIKESRSRDARKTYWVLIDKNVKINDQILGV